MRMMDESKDRKTEERGMDEDCRTCLEGDVEGYKTIYTRPKKKGDNEEKE